VFLIGIIYPFGELNIMGIYTDEKMLIRIYDKLVKDYVDLEYVGVGTKKIKII
jgi:hypothetical protein